MKRILILLGIFIGLGLAAVVVVLATRQDVTYGSNNAVDIKPGNTIAFQSSGGYARMSVSAELPKTNAAPISVH